MPQWAGSCWYYLRYCDARNDERFVGEDAEKYWMGDGDGKTGGIDLYVGGTEHAVLHLLYARFWHKVLFDLGYVSKPEPFQRLVNQGMILGEDGQKMSKSRGNVVNPDDVIDEYGADSLRLFEMFMGPLEQVKPWSMKGVEGVYRFLSRAWRLFMESDAEGNWSLSAKIADIEPTGKQRKVLHETIKKVTHDTEALAFNTAISKMMECVNEFTQAEERSASALATFLQLLNPYAPHLSEELNAQLAASFDASRGRGARPPGMAGPRRVIPRRGRDRDGRPGERQAARQDHRRHRRHQRIDRSRGARGGEGPAVPRGQHRAQASSSSPAS